MLALEASGGKTWQDKSNGKRRGTLAGKTEEGPAKQGVVKARKEVKITWLREEAGHHRLHLSLKSDQL